MRSSLINSDDDDQINSNSELQLAFFKIPIRKELICEEPNN